jgi:hypothetical protein
VYAVGIGNIELCIASGQTLKLTDVLHIPESSVRLISILALNKSGNYTTHFNSDGCWITDKNNTTLVHGTLSAAKHLYTLTSASLPMTHSALFTKVPDIETWHRHLGHCNTHSIIEMATNEVLQGMPIDLSTLPAKCC